MRHATQLFAKRFQAYFSDGSFVELIPSASKRGDRPAADMRIIARLHNKPIAYELLEAQLKDRYLEPRAAAGVPASGRMVLTTITRVDGSGFRTEIITSKEVP